VWIEALLNGWDSPGSAQWVILLAAPVVETHRPCSAMLSMPPGLVAYSSLPAALACAPSTEACCWVCWADEVNVVMQQLGVTLV
jgi:hypothetical protein